MRLWQKAPAGEESFEALRERLFGNVLTLLAILTSLGLLILLLRVRLIGWQPFMVAQLISLGGIVGLALLRPLGIRRRLLLLTGLMLLFVTSSTLQLGPAADSRGFLLFLAFLIGFFLTPRAAVYYSLLMLLWVAWRLPEIQDRGVAVAAAILLAGLVPLDSYWQALLLTPLGPLLVWLLVRTAPAKIFVS